MNPALTPHANRCTMRYRKATAEVKLKTKLQLLDEFLATRPGSPEAAELMAAYKASPDVGRIGELELGESDDDE